MTAGLLLSTLLAVATGTAVPIPAEGGDSCSVRIRDARTDEVLVRERDPLLGAPEDGNNAPGPGSLRAVVRGGRPSYVIIVNTATGTSRRLCQGTQPRFSPNGRWIACNHWESSERPWNLTVVDVRSGNSRIIEHVGQIEDYAWSPDSKQLAFTSIAHDSSWRFNIGWIEAGSGSVHILASDDESNVEWMGLEWAPDDRRLLATRHREYEHDDSIYASDLWLFDLKARPCRLTHTPREDEDSAGWIDGRRIRYQSSGSRDDPSSDPRRYVIELEPERDRH